MSSKIEQVIDEIEEYLDTCKYVPFSSTNISVDKEEIEELSETVSDLENRAVHLPYSVENSEIQNISANTWTHKTPHTYYSLRQDHTWI